MQPLDSLLQGSNQRQALLPVLEAAETALRTWEPSWTPLLAAAVREEAEQRLAALSDLHLDNAGGYPAAEHRRLLLQRAEAAQPAESLDAGLGGLEISGNFLFDPAEPGDFRVGLVAAGAWDGELGDLWIRGDRGAQAIVSAELAQRLHDQLGRVRSVEVRFEARPIDELQLPAERIERTLTTVEASLRLDAVGSAGFGLSRSRLVERIRRGDVRIDWQTVTSPSRELAPGQRVQLAGRGELLVEATEPTQRGRWRVTLRRR